MLSSLNISKAYYFFFPPKCFHLAEVERLASSQDPEGYTGASYW
jgi:hypothetical protein